MSHDADTDEFDRDDGPGHANEPAGEVDRAAERRETREGYHEREGPEGVTDERGGGTRTHEYSEDDTSWTAIAGGLVLVGAVLFFVPEPITSSLGVLLVVAGAGLWVADQLS